jgi:hypothetical protein
MKWGPSLNPELSLAAHASAARNRIVSYCLRQQGNRIQGWETQEARENPRIYPRAKIVMEIVTAELNRMSSETFLRKWVSEEVEIPTALTDEGREEDREKEEEEDARRRSGYYVLRPTIQTTTTISSTRGALWAELEGVPSPDSVRKRRRSDFHGGPPGGYHGVPPPRPKRPAPPPPGGFHGGPPGGSHGVPPPRPKRPAPPPPGADLTGAHLEDLTGAHLEGTDLTGAHLEGADLRDAHMEGADLRDAHMEGANLLGSTFGFSGESPLGLSG